MDGEARMECCEKEEFRNQALLVKVETIETGKWTLAVSLDGGREGNLEMGTTQSGQGTNSKGISSGQVGRTLQLGEDSGSYEEVTLLPAPATEVSEGGHRQM